MSAIIRVVDLRRDYRMGGEDVHALRGVSFDVASGEYVAVVGPSGCGKSTLLNLIGAVDRPSGGEVIVADRAIATYSPGSTARVTPRSACTTPPLIR